MNIRRPITHHLLESTERPADWTALRFKRHKTWYTLDWKEYARRAEAVGAALAALGVTRGDRVAIVANTRWEWAVSDFGILGLGAITVPVYQSNRAEEIEQILHNAEPRVVIVEDVAQLRKLDSFTKKVKSIERVICMATNDVPAHVMTFDALLDSGVERLKEDPEVYRREVLATRLEEPATIVYTSGTTGEPKGAVLTHDQALSEVEDVTRAFPISPMDSTLSFLPYAHVFGRVELWLHAYVGFTMSFAESIERLRANLADVKPTVIMGVPRIFEKIYAGLLTQIEGHPLRKQIFDWLNVDRGWWW